MDTSLAYRIYADSTKLDLQTNLMNTSDSALIQLLPVSRDIHEYMDECIDKILKYDHYLNLMDLQITADVVALKQFGRCNANAKHNRCHMCGYFSWRKYLLSWYPAGGNINSRGYLVISSTTCKQYFNISERVLTLLNNNDRRLGNTQMYMDDIYLYKIITDALPLLTDAIVKKANMYLHNTIIP